MNNVVIITGASRGIGAATARLAGQRGYAVCINYRDSKTDAETVATDIHKAGGQAVIVQADTAREDDIERMFQTVDSELGIVTALVNNAGITGGFCRVENVNTALLRKVMDVNITGYFLCAREAVRRMSTRRGGTGGVIVNVSSCAARLGSPGEYVHYAASKGAVDSMTIGMARELAGEGIRVNAVHPGLIDTDIHARGGRPDRVQQFSHKVPLGRGGTAEEVAEAILWLMSDASSFTTGAFVPVSGGL